MSALAVTEPTTRIRPAGLPQRPPQPHLRPVTTVLSAPDATSGPDETVTVTVRVDGGAGPRRDRVLHALRELLDAADGGSATAATATVGGAVADRMERELSAPVRIDQHARTVRRGTEVLTLSRLEFDLFAFLARHPRRVFSRNQLLHQVWGHQHTSARTIDVHVSRLRTKLGVDPDLITTVYGVGYRLADDADVALAR